MEKQMQETVEEANEGVTADMLFSACIEEKLPAEMLAAFDVTECLSSKPDCETLLLRDKQTGQKVVAKCYDRTEGMRQQEILCLKNKACPPSWVIPTSKDTLVRVEDFSKIIPSVFPCK